MESMNSQFVREDVSDVEHGALIGNCKWFNKKLGYGFVTVYQGEHKGVNIFVHHSGIKPLNSNFRTLRKGEYVSMDIEEGKNGLQAINVSGILGGPLMCDNHIQKTNNAPSSVSSSSSPSPPPPLTESESNDQPQAATIMTGGTDATAEETTVDAPEVTTSPTCDESESTSPTCDESESASSKQQQQQPEEEEA